MPVMPLLRDETQVLQPLRQAGLVPIRATALILAAAGAGWAVLDSWGLTIGDPSGVLARAILVTAAAVMATRVWLSWQDTTVTVTDQRVILEKGMFAGSSRVFAVRSIRDLRTQQTMLGRLLDYGNVEVLLDGGYSVIVNDVSGPHLLRDYLFKLATGEDDGP